MKWKKNNASFLSGLCVEEDTCCSRRKDVDFIVYSYWVDWMDAFHLYVFIEWMVLHKKIIKQKLLFCMEHAFVLKFL
jgi:hypothetical protein